VKRPAGFPTRSIARLYSLCPLDATSRRHVWPLGEAPLPIAPCGVPPMRRGEVFADGHHFAAGHETETAPMSIRTAISSARKCLRVMRRFHPARAAIFARVAEFGKNVVPLLGLRTWGRFPGVRPQSVKCLRENRSFAHNKSGARCYFVAWEWASTNHSHLSMPRETSVNRSAVSASSKASASSIVARASRPKVESARATAST
jgi:hypothetical protein